MRSKLGFTLMEAIVTLAVLAVASAIAVPTAMGLTRKANATACTETQKALERQYTLRHEMAPQLKDPAALLQLAEKAAVRSGGEPYGGGAQYTGLCPDGGVYVLQIDAEGALHVVCSFSAHARA